MIAGNQVPTYFPQTFIDHEVLRDMIVCRHDGELVMRALVAHVRGERALDDIPGIVYRDTQTDAVRETPVINVDPDLLIHPSSGESARPGITNMLQAGRGCIFGCSYCTQHQRGWRPFPLARVLENVERYVAKGVTELEFCDDEFFGGRSANALRRVDEFAVGMRRIAEKYQTKLSFRIFTTPLIVARAQDSDKIREQNRRVRETFERLIEAGLVRVYIGLESGSVPQKDRYDRRETIEDTALALQVLRELKLDIDVGFIMFDPHLSVQEMLDNVNYFRANELVRHNTWPFRPLVVNEGTPVKTRLADAGLLTGEQDPDFLSYGYRFVDPDVERINAIVQSLAAETKPIFYTLKSLSKLHWKGAPDDWTHFARMATERNAHVYLDLMDRLGRAALRRQDHDHHVVDAAKAALLELISMIVERLASLRPDELDGGHDNLRQHLAAFEGRYSDDYRRAAQRSRDQALHHSTGPADARIPTTAAAS